MNRAIVEYVGFRTTDERREYRLRLRLGAESREYTIGIPHAAFADGRARFQDGPEICYRKLQSELDASGDDPAESDFTITDAELAAYRVAHTPAPRGRGKSHTPEASAPPAPEEASWMLPPGDE